MKRSLLVLLAIGFVAGGAFAAGSTGPFSGIDFTQRFLKGGMYVGAGATAEVNNKVTKIRGNTATVDFTSRSSGRGLSSSFTVTGAAVGDRCAVAVPAAAGALNADFGCVVDAADSAKVYFVPTDTTVTTCTLNGATPSVCTAAVIAGSTCTATPVGATAAIAAGGAAVGLSGTTLTVTAAAGATHVVNIACAAPVDPASSTFGVTTFSHL